MIGYSGIPKMAFYGIKEAMGVVDSSLLYPSLGVQGGQSLRESGVSLWVESELAVPVSCSLTLRYAQVGGSEVIMSKPTCFCFVQPFSSPLSRACLGKSSFVS